MIQKDRIAKYVIMFMALYLALSVIPYEPISDSDIVIVSTIGVIVFALLDMFMPMVICKR